MNNFCTDMHVIIEIVFPVYKYLLCKNDFSIYPVRSNSNNVLAMFCTERGQQNIAE